MTLHRYTPYYKPLTMLGVPIVVGQLGTIVLAFADTLMIGHHATSELAAAAFVNNIINLVIIFALGFSYAVTPTVGTLYGQEKTNASARWCATPSVPTCCSPPSSSA